jgi:hypothetical protein
MVDGESDVAIVPATDGGSGVLVEVVNPFGRALLKGIDLNQELRNDPETGNNLLSELVQETRRDIASVLEAGASGILYRLHGASPAHCSPMQYGGFYLERDRELLGEAVERGFTLLFIVGDEETYLDFVSDLPAHAIAWDVRRTGYSLNAMREMRTGAIAADDDSAEIELMIPMDEPSLAARLEGALLHA